MLHALFASAGHHYKQILSGFTVMKLNAGRHPVQLHFSTHSTSTLMLPATASSELIFLRGSAKKASVSTLSLNSVQRKLNGVWALGPRA